MRRICAGQHSELEAQAIRENWTPAATELAVLRAERSAVPAWTSGGDTTPVSSDDMLVGGLLTAAGQGEIVERYIGAGVANRCDSMRGWHFMDFARFALQNVGQYRTSMGQDELLRAAFSTTSLAVAMSTAANKTVLASYEAAPSAWRAVCSIRSVRDFKVATGLRLCSMPNLTETGPAGELKHGELDESTYEYQISTFGEMISITRQMLYNDDAGLLSDIGPSLGRSAARTVNDLFATTLLANAGSFFAAGNSNYFEGAAESCRVHR